MILLDCLPAFVVQMAELCCGEFAVIVDCLAEILKTPPKHASAKLQSH